MSKVLVVGSLCVDHYQTNGTASSLLFPGGKGGNQAVAARRLGETVCLVAMVGEDEDGEFLLQNLKAEGISTAQIQKKAGARTGRCLIKLSAAGENQIQGYPGANLLWDQRDLEHTLPLLQEAACLLLQLEIPLNIVWALLEAAQAWGKLVILNLGPPRPTELPELGEQTYLVLNAQEAHFYTKIQPKDFVTAQYAAAVLREKAKHVVITMGGQGAVLATGNKCCQIKSPQRKVVDTTGAGDAFCAALAVALLRGDSPDEATSYACNVASLATTTLGAH